MYRLFISYATPHRKQAERIASALDDGFDVFLDIDKISTGDHVPRRIMDEIGTCDAAVIVVSPGASSRPWIDAEIKHMRRCWSNFESRAFVVLVNGATREDVPARLDARRYLEWSDNNEASVQLIQDIKDSMRHSEDSMRRRRRKRAARASLLAAPIVLFSGIAGAWVLGGSLVGPPVGDAPSWQRTPTTNRPPTSVAGSSTDRAPGKTGSPLASDGTGPDEHESHTEIHEEDIEKTCRTDEDCGAGATCIRTTPLKRKKLAQATKPIELSSKTLVVGPRHCPNGWRRDGSPTVRASGSSVRCDAQWHAEDPRQCEVHVVLTGPVYDEAKCTISTLLRGPRPSRGKCSS